MKRSSRSQDPTFLGAEARTLIFVHLEDDPRGPLKRAAIEHTVQEAFSEFFNMAFASVGEPALLPPSVCVKQFGSADEMATGLVSAAGTLCDGMEGVVAFLLDELVPQSPGGSPVPLHDCFVGNLRLPDWLNLSFPAIPKMSLTRLPASATSRGGDWDYFPKDRFGNPADCALALKRAFEAWWWPTFSRALFAYADGAKDSWHTPGHNLGNAFYRSPFQHDFHERYGHFSFATDLSVSVEDLGDLSDPIEDTPLHQSEQRTAEIFGAGETFYVTNGSSTSNKALLMALLRPNDVVLVDRNCHKSVHQAIVMSGAWPLYLPVPFNPELGVSGPVSCEVIRLAVEEVKARRLHPRLLVLTTCTYEGFLYPVWDIAAFCEDNGILFMADEAWAPHLRFHPRYLVSREGHLESYAALGAGNSAHVVVQSTHKFLAAFSQASMIHLSTALKECLSTDSYEWLRSRYGGTPETAYSRLRHEVLETLRYWHSTSPHYPMLASLDRAGIQMRLEGMHLLGERLRWVEDPARLGSLGGSSLRLEHLVGGARRAEYESYGRDPLRVVLRYATLESGPELKAELRRKDVQWEKTSLGCVEFLVTLGTTDGNVKCLVDALEAHRDLLAAHPDAGVGASRPIEMMDGKVVMSPQRAVAADVDYVPIERAAGRVSAQMIVPYPPGIPIAVPGMVLADDAVERITAALQAGGTRSLHGAFSEQGSVLVRVVRSKDVASEANTGIELLAESSESLLRRYGP